MSSFRTLDDFNLAGRRMLLRADINVPMRNGIATDTARIKRIIPTLNEVLKEGVGVVLCSHLGRPNGQVIKELSLETLLPLLNAFLPNTKINFSPRGEVAVQPGEIVLLENLRFNPGEESNEPAFAEFLSKLGDIYINDAFSCAHRAHASIDGVARLMPSGAGRLMQRELEALDCALNNPSQPVAAIVGGNKISTKIRVLENLIGKVDHLIVGGAMANTFLYASGVSVGSSLCEKDMADTAENIIKKAENCNCEIHLPVDAVVSDELNDGATSNNVSIDSIPPEKMVLDVGPETADNIGVLLGECKTLVWNGPLGAFEFKPFDAGTNAIAKAASK